MSLTDTIELVREETDQTLNRANSSFSKEIPNLQTALDSTSIGDAKTCLRLYYYRMIRGFTGPKIGLAGTETEGQVHENPHTKFGHIYHSAGEAYEHAKAAGADHEEAVREAVKHALFRTYDPETGRFWESDEPTKTQKTLLRTIVLYYDKYKDDPLKTYILPDGKPAVELSYRVNLGNSDPRFIAPSGEHYIACGHLDRVVEWNDELWDTDKKTTKYQLDDRYFAGYNPDNQMTKYTLFGGIVLRTKVEGVIVDAAQVLVEGSRFQRKPTYRTESQLEEWLTDLSIYLRILEACADKSYWPMNDKACHLFGGCKFRPVCAADPSTRDELLEAFYEKRTWDPLQPR